MTPKPPRSRPKSELMAMGVAGYLRRNPLATEAEAEKFMRGVWLELVGMFGEDWQLTRAEREGRDD